MERDNEGSAWFEYYFSETSFLHVITAADADMISNIQIREDGCIVLSDTVYLGAQECMYFKLRKLHRKWSVLQMKKEVREGGRS